MKSLFRPMVVIFAALTVVTGLAYPAVVTAFGQAVFHDQTNGSLSATTPMPYNAQGSSGSNIGPVNPALADEVKGRLDALKAAGHMPAGFAVPVDLVTSSGSGLDPEISPAAAAFQIERVAAARKMNANDVAALVDRYTRGRQFGLFGEARVNVLELNIALDDAQRG